MKILMMGPQGSGKGTVGELLSKHFNLPIIASGQLLREVPSTNPNYEMIQDQMKQGILVSQELVSGLLKDRVSQPDCNGGYIIDGWGRTMIDLQYFDPGYDVVFYLSIQPETVIQRISNRRTCKKCGKIYNLITLPPKVENVCDVCGGELYQRADDTPDAIRRRLEIFNTQTREVYEYYKSQGILVEIDAEPMPDVIFQNILSVLKSHDSLKNA